MVLLRWGLLVAAILCAVVLLLASDLSGVVPAVVALVFAVFVCRRVRRAEAMFDAELDAWLGRTGGRG